ncbi:MAG: Hint domain-containing protein [Pseudomonadota bacterium]
MWFALSDPNGSQFRPQGLSAPADAAPVISTGPDALLPRGSLMIETRLPPINRPRALLVYDRGGQIPMHLSLQALPGGGLVFVLDQDGEMLHGSISAAETGRTDILRVTYAWDAPARWGRLSLERPEDHVVQMVDVRRPKPLPVADIRALTAGEGLATVAPEVLFVAVSSAVEPVGPMPSLAPETPLATPQGYRAADDIRRGDLVRCANGQDVPVLQRVDRVVPACGSFRPVTLKAPYFDLLSDIDVASFQRVVLRGSVVEYMFGTEAVLVPAAHLTGVKSAASVPLPANAPLIRYVQLLLPGNEAILAAGTSVESLYIGRLRRKPDQLGTSLLAGYDRARLPEHARPAHRVLPPYEAAVLAQTRAA